MLPREAWPVDWPERLHAHIAAAGARGHVWGANDCALFTCNWIRAISGHDPAAAFRGRYSTAKGSLRALRRYGQGELLATFSALMPPPVARLKARRGDACALWTEAGFALGLVADNRAVFLAPDKGLTLMPLTSLHSVFPVG